MRLILLGPPGAGKGTLAACLAQKLAVPHLASGDILREQVRQGTDLGRSVQGYLDSGDLVPDEIIVQIMIDRLARQDCSHGYILDGFPRTEPQAQALNESFLAQGDQPIDLVIYLEADTEVIVSRLAGRKVCPQCGFVYNLQTLPPKVKDKCDRDDADLQTRGDDDPQVIRTRLEKYRSLTQPLLDYYRRAGRFCRLNANRSIEEVNKEAAEILSKTCTSIDEV